MVKCLRVINKLISLIHLRYHFKSYSLAHPLVGHQPSVELRRMLPHRMIIPSSVLKLHSSIGQGQAVNSLYTALLSLEHMALYDSDLLSPASVEEGCGYNISSSLSLHFRRVWGGVQGSLAMASGCYN